MWIFLPTHQSGHLAKQITWTESKIFPIISTNIFEQVSFLSKHNKTHSLHVSHHKYNFLKVSITLNLIV